MPARGKDAAMTAPIREGYGPTERAAQELGRHTLAITKAATLRDLAKDYVFFNHGSFFVHGRLDCDPVADFVAQHPDPDCKVMPTAFPTRLFPGLAAPGRPAGPPLDWERTLCFVERAYWPALFDHLRLCGWVDRRRKFYARAVAQELPLVDVLALEKALVVPAPLPTVPVVLFGVDGTRDHVQFISRITLPTDRPMPVHRPLDPETRAIGAALLAGEDRPFRFVEGDPLERLQGLVLRPHRAPYHR
jgi:hypothetical protein